MLRISFLAVKVEEVAVVTVTIEFVSAIESTGVERRMVPGLKSDASPRERDCVPI